MGFNIEEVAAVGRCRADGDAQEALRLLRAVAEKIRHAQATA
ncbi:MAG: hypothetical protein Kow0092_34470 [Deferrisomatales bacterium]